MSSGMKRLLTDKVTVIPEHGQADPKIGARICSSETSLSIYHSVLRQIPEDLNLLPLLSHFQLICTAADTMVT